MGVGGQCTIRKTGGGLILTASRLTWHCQDVTARLGKFVISCIEKHNSSSDACSQCMHEDASDKISITSFAEIGTAIDTGAAALTVDLR
jgi:hypothetical protein